MNTSPTLLTWNLTEGFWKTISSGGFHGGQEGTGTPRFQVAASRFLGAPTRKELCYVVLCDIPFGVPSKTSKTSHPCLSKQVRHAAYAPMTPGLATAKMRGFPPKSNDEPPDKPVCSDPMAPFFAGMAITFFGGFFGRPFFLGDPFLGIFICGFQEGEPSWSMGLFKNYANIE